MTTMRTFDPRTDTYPLPEVEDYGTNAAPIRQQRTVCTCGHAFSSHRPDTTDPWSEGRCKTCGCSSFDDGRPSDPEDEA